MEVDTIDFFLVPETSCIFVTKNDLFVEWVIKYKCTDLIVNKIATLLHKQPDYLTHLMELGPLEF